jgi:hypothetical protein
MVLALRNRPILFVEELALNLPHAFFLISGPFVLSQAKSAIGHCADRQPNARQMRYFLSIMGHERGGGTSPCVPF